MMILLLHSLLVTSSLLILNQLFLVHLIGDNYYYISNQLKYFISKTILLAIITYFFCFFSPLNSTKFILLTLAIFIIFHFTEAVVIQKKINLKDSNE